MAWFAFDVDDYDADTMHLSAAQDGVYMRLLRFYYKTRVALPDNDAALAHIGRISIDEWEGMKTTIRAFFKSRRGRLHHKRCDKELDREDALAKKRSEKSRNAAEKRHGKSRTYVLRASLEHEPGITVSMLGDATRPDQTIELPREDKNAKTAIEPPPVEPLPLQSAMREKIRELGSGLSGRKNAWTDQQKRDEYAVAACLPHLPAKSDGDRWAIAMAAEDQTSPDHHKAVKMMLQASKAAGVGWVSPERRGSAAA